MVHVMLGIHLVQVVKVLNIRLMPMLKNGMMPLKLLMMVIGAFMELLKVLKMDQM